MKKPSHNAVAAALMLSITVASAQAGSTLSSRELEIAAFEGQPVLGFYDHLRKLGLTPLWSNIPGKQVAALSEGFWCRATLIVMWTVEDKAGVPVATNIESQSDNDCD